MANESEFTYDVETAGKKLGLSRPLAYRAAKNGELPIIKIGRRLLVPKAALEKMLANAGSQPVTTAK